MRDTPIKIAIERRPRRGRDLAFAEWIHQLAESARTQAGHEGTSVFSMPDGLSIVVLRFARRSALETWQGSGAYAALMRQADEVSQGLAEQRQCGLETWFALPNQTLAPGLPPRWKMAVTTWLCLLPMVLALSFVLGPLHLPFLAQTALSTAIPVAMLTWVVMPRVTRWLHRWLYRGRQPHLGLAAGQLPDHRRSTHAEGHHTPVAE